MTSAYESGLSFEKYLALGTETKGGPPVINASLLKELTPKHVKEVIDKQESDDTTSTTIGTVVHTAILEPDSMESLDNRFAFVQTKSLDSKAAEVARDLNPDKTVINAEAYSAAMQMRDAVYASHQASWILKNSPDRELTGVGAIADEGIIRKCRVDATGGTHASDPNWKPWLADIKTTRMDLEPWAFHGECKRMGYYIQAAYYLDLDEIITGKKREKFFFIAVTNNRPFYCRVFEVPQARIEEARQIYTHRLASLIHAIAHNEWEAYESESEPCMLPAPPPTNQ